MEVSGTAVKKLKRGTWSFQTNSDRYLSTFQVKFGDYSSHDGRHICKGLLITRAANALQGQLHHDTVMEHLAKAEFYCYSDRKLSPRAVPEHLPYLVPGTTPVGGAACAWVLVVGGADCVWKKPKPQASIRKSVTKKTRTASQGVSSAPYTYNSYLLLTSMLGTHL